MGKWYAVLEGRKTGIFPTWEECKAQVDGYSGAKYKSFKSLSEAEAYMQGGQTVEAEELTAGRYDAVAYVDGSFNEIGGGMTGGGGVLYLGDKAYPFAVNSEQKELCEMRNVGGEILSAMAAVEKAKELSCKSLLICHDYEGIGAWATGAWKTNKAATRAYAEYMKDCGIEVSFEKVAAHTGVEGNELADGIAKYAVGLLTHDQYHDKVSLKVGGVEVCRAWLDVHEGERSSDRFEQLPFEAEMA